MPASDQEAAQIDLIRGAFGEGNIAIHPDNWDQPGVEVEYLYRSNKFIVRDANLGRVIEYLETGRGERVDNRVDPDDPSSLARPC